MKEKKEVTLIEDMNEYKGLGDLTNNSVSGINKDSENKNFTILTDLKGTENNTKSYYCKYCKQFPLLKPKNNQYLIWKCNCKNEENSEKTYEDVFTEKFTEIKTEEKIAKLLKDYFSCKTHEKKYQAFCMKCNKNICEVCESECKEKHKGEKEYKRFKELDENDKLENMEKFYDNYYNNEFIINSDDKKPQSEISVSEKNVTIRTEEGRRVFNKKEEKDFLQYINAKNIISVILNNMEIFPHYNHYLNIENFNSYFFETLEIAYENKENYEQEIQLFGKNFFDKNKNNCYLKINGEKKELVKGYNIPKKKKLIILLIKKNPISDMSEMFSGCSCLYSLKIKTRWAMDTVTNMSSMLSNCSNLNNLNCAEWNTSEVKNFSKMFYECKSLKDLTLNEKFNTNKAENLEGMFSGCSSIEYIYGISEWKTFNVKDMSSIFSNCQKLKQKQKTMDLSKWDISNVEKLTKMFKGCKSLKSIEFSENIKSSKFKKMDYMFADCDNLEKLTDFSSWNTENVTHMNNMFQNCDNLKQLVGLSKWDTKAVKNMAYMFQNCKNLEQEVFQDISNWKTGSVNDFNEMFDGINENIKKPSWYKDE
jgi:surface protein